MSKRWKVALWVAAVVMPGGLLLVPFLIAHSRRKRAERPSAGSTHEEPSPATEASAATETPSPGATVDPGASASTPKPDAFTAELHAGPRGSAL